jgi:hypothetical protein
VARPVALMVATLGEEEAQVAVFVMSCVLVSESVAAAWNCQVCPVGTVFDFGVTAIDTITGFVTVTAAVPATASKVAVMLIGPPGATPLTLPLERVATPFATVTFSCVTETWVASAVVQSAHPVRSAVVPSS